MPHQSARRPSGIDRCSVFWEKAIRNMLSPEGLSALRCSGNYIETIVDTISGEVSEDFINKVRSLNSDRPITNIPKVREEGCRIAEIALLVFEYCKNAAPLSYVKAETREYFDTLRRQLFEEGDRNPENTIYSAGQAGYRNGLSNGVQTGRGGR